MDAATLNHKNISSVLFVVNADWFFISHRLAFAKFLASQGIQVIVAAGDTGKCKEIIGENLSNIPLSISRGSYNLLKELKAVAHLVSTIIRRKPTAVYCVSQKGIIYGGLAARICGHKNVIHAFSGLGYIFTNGRRSSAVGRIVAQLLKAAISPAHKIIFQNEDDKRIILEVLRRGKNNSFLVAGVGVNIKKFEYSELQFSGIKRLVLPSRMLYDKGVVEFVEAARLLKPKFKHQLQFLLAGPLDEHNPARITKTELDSFLDGEYIQWLGFSSDMYAIYSSCHMVVFPSYREGLPKALLEASAVGRPIITTDVPGCRDVVLDGKSGFLVPSKSATELAWCIERLVVNEQLMKTMGRFGRNRCESNFDERVIFRELLSITNLKAS